MIGQTLDHYQILEKLGEGGMGVVYRAHDAELDRDVAVKVLPAKLMQDRTAVERFIREARAASALNHPNIVTIHGIGETEAGRFIVMELVVGRTLRAMAGELLTPETLVELSVQVAKALAAAHAAGIVHRDVKPENIMVRDDGYVKVLDFGLARLMPGNRSQSASETVSVTDAGALIGTVRYMSPEQAHRRAVDSATDIFSLGIVLYELAAGRHPFEADSQIEVLHAIATETPLLVSRLNPEIPTALESLIVQMLEKDPRLRPTAAEVDAALAGLAGGRPSVEHGSAISVVQRHIVGRDKERAELTAAFESVAGGRGLLLCVAGEPGIGKTTLVEQFLAELSAGNVTHRVARGRCSERLAGTEAYLPFLEALEDLLHGPDREAVAHTMRLVAPGWYLQVVPGAAEDPASAPLLAAVKAASQERMKRELSVFLQEVSRSRPLILFFDDLQWADVSTVDLLSYLASKFGSLRVLLVVTYRPTDLLLAKHPFLRVKLDLQSRGVCRELPLDFLSRHEVEEYLLLEFPEHRFPVEFPALIHSRTEGSPLFMVDLLRYLVDRKVITSEQGCWILAGSIPAIERQLPESVRGMIERKIDQLVDADRLLLVAASVQGLEFDSAVVARTLGRDAVDIEERLEVLDRVHFFLRLIGEREFPDHTLTRRYRFVHVLYQNALYASATPARKASLSAAVAQVLLEYYGKRSFEVASELALLFETARNFPRAVDHFLVATKSAIRVFAFQEASALARRGLELLKATPDSPQHVQQELKLEIVLGVSLAAIKGFAAPEAGEAYSRARELAQQAGEVHKHIGVVWGLWGHYTQRGELARMKALAEEFLGLADGQDDPIWLVVGEHAMGVSLYFLGEPATALQHLESGNALYTKLPKVPFFLAMDPGVACQAHAAWALWILGYPDRALKRAHEAIASARKISHPISVGWTLTRSAVLHQFRGEICQARECSEAAIEISREHGFAWLSAVGDMLRGWALCGQGQREDGIAIMRESLASQRTMYCNILRPHFLALLADALLQAGRPQDAEAVLTDALSIIRSTGECYYEAEVDRLKGELLLMQSPPDTTAAESCFREGIDTARHQSARSLELRAATSLGRLLQRQQKNGEARKTISEIRGWFTEGFETADLNEAGALLEDLSSSTR